MVTQQRYYNYDPNKQGRGAGMYYLRGHGYFSKFLESRDRKRKASGWQTSIIGQPKDSSHYYHVTDGNIRDYWRRYGQSKRR